MNGSTGIVPTMPINGNNSFDNGLWIVLLLALMFGNNGFGGWGNNGFNNVATTDYVSSEFTQRDINSGFQNTNNLISDGFQSTAANICGLKSDVLENRYAAQLSACNTQRDILQQTNELNTNLLTTALQNQAKMDDCCCSIKNAIREDGEATRALITSNTIQDLRDRLQDAQNTITSTAVSNNVINAVRPYPVPSWTVSSPYVGLYNGFYGSNWYGNTIV